MELGCLYCTKSVPTNSITNSDIHMYYALQIINDFTHERVKQSTISILTTVPD